MCWKLRPLSREAKCRQVDGFRLLHFCLFSWNRIHANEKCWVQVGGPSTVRCWFALHLEEGLTLFRDVRMIQYRIETNRISPDLIRFGSESASFGFERFGHFESLVFRYRIWRAIWTPFFWNIKKLYYTGLFWIFQDSIRFVHEFKRFDSFRFQKKWADSIRFEWENTDSHISNPVESIHTGMSCCSQRHRIEAKSTAGLG